VDAAEAAVGHDDDGVARAQFGCETADDLVCAVVGVCGTTLCVDLADEFVCI